MYIFVKSYVFEEKNLFSYKYLSRNENVLKTITRVCVSFEDYCYKNCKIDSGTRIQEFQLNHFSNDPRDYLFFKGSEISWLLFSQTTTWNQSCIHYTGEEEFFMWIIFFENNGRRMFATCAYPFRVSHCFHPVQIYLNFHPAMSTP